MNIRRWVCLLLCAALLFSLMGVTAHAAYDDRIIPGAALQTRPAVVGEAIETPMLRQSDTENFRIVSFQWYRGLPEENRTAAVGSTYADDDYYLEISIRLQGISGIGIDRECYLGGGYLEEVSRSVDPDAGAVHSLFHIRAVSTARASVTLPTVWADASIGSTLREAPITFADGAKAMTTFLVYEDDALLTVGGFNANGEFIWANPTLRFREGSTYRILALAAVNDLYVPQSEITVVNPALADSLTLVGNECGVGYEAQYFCKRIPTVTRVEVSGIPLPVQGALPDLDSTHLVCAAPELYRAEYLQWSRTDAPFTGGERYSVSLLLTPQPNTIGLQAETPVTFNGVPASFVREQDGGYVFCAAFDCPPVAVLTSAEVVGIPVPVEGDLPALACESAAPELYSARCLSWSNQNTPFEGGKTYCVRVLLTPLPGVVGLNEATPVTFNGIPARYEGAQDGGLVFTADFTAAAIEKLPFRDVGKDDWFYADVDFCFRRNLMNGTGDNLFTPAGHCTRAMIVTILYRLEGSPEVTCTDIFRDVPDGTWYTDAVLWAAEQEIVFGYGDDTFGPANKITREQFASILYRFTARRDTNPIVGALSAYPDAGQVHDWAYDAMGWAVGRGILTGKPIGTDLCLQPRGFATRAECAAILARYCSSLK